MKSIEKPVTLPRRQGRRAVVTTVFRFRGALRQLLGCGVTARLFTGHANPKGIPAQSPGLRGTSYLGQIHLVPNPNGLCHAVRDRLQPVGVGVILAAFSQGSSCLATWAGRRNPFGIGCVGRTHVGDKGAAATLFTGSRAHAMKSEIRNRRPKEIRSPNAEATARPGIRISFRPSFEFVIRHSSFSSSCSTSPSTLNPPRPTTCFRSAAPTLPRIAQRRVQRPRRSHSRRLGEVDGRRPWRRFFDFGKERRGSL